jgi:hypothetical protein
MSRYIGYGIQSNVKKKAKVTLYLAYVGIERLVEV